jgi:hypothetical protein
MNVRDRVFTVEPPADRHAEAATPVEVEEAERLISDLTALLDAGLIEIQQHVLGPIRYGVA